MDYQQFAQHCHEVLPENISKRTEAFVNRLEEVFGDPSEANFNDTDSLKYVFCINSAKVGKTTFYHIKRMLRLFYEELQKEGLATEETVKYLDALNMETVAAEIEVGISFFKDLRSAINFMKMVGHYYQYNDDELFLYKAIVITAWYGIKDPQDLRKEQIRDGAIHIPGKAPIKIPEKEYMPLELLRDAKEYRGFPTPRVFNFLDSEWLFRGMKSDHLVKHNILSLLYCFSTRASEYGKNITMSSLTLNGLFDYVRTHRSDKSVAVQIYELLGCTRQVAFSYEKTYNAWIKTYWKE